jgi:hypothetical protein
MGFTRRHLAGLLFTFALSTGVAAPASAFAEEPVSSPGMELFFAGEYVKSAGGQVVVSVTCVGKGPGFCAGVVTLSSRGHHQTVPFSVRRGTRESLFVPFRLEGARKVRGVATTDQRLGPPSSTETFLYAH